MDWYQSGYSTGREEYWLSWEAAYARAVDTADGEPDAAAALAAFSDGYTAGMLRRVEHNAERTAVALALGHLRDVAMLATTLGDCGALDSLAFGEAWRHGTEQGECLVREHGRLAIAPALFRLQ